MSEIQPAPAPSAQPPPPPPPADKPKKRSLLWLWILLGCLGLLFVMIPVILVAMVLGKIASGGAPSAGGPGVAIIRIEGVITAGRSTSGFMEAGVTGSETIVRQIRRAMDNSDAKAIMIRINSPGGSAAGSEEIYRELLEARKKKPVVASMGDVGASGGYYIASAADTIYCNGGTMTGSIGVIISYLEASELLDKIGVKDETLTSGEFKDTGSFSRPMTKKERQLLEAMLKDVHEQFVEAVVRGRHMPEKKVQGLADGRIFTGRQALKEGLVDEIGGFEEAFEAAAKKGNIKGKPRRIEYGPKGFLDMFLGVDDYTASMDSLAKEMLMRRALQEVSSKMLE